MTARDNFDIDLKPCPFCHEIPDVSADGYIEHSPEHDEACNFDNPSVENWNNAYCWKEIESRDEIIKKLWEALKGVDDWFENLKKDHHKKLVENQTFESACENWNNLDQTSLDMTPIKEALALIEKKEGANES